jgi:NodT family efflux transporter outer membrane factor (OMF) lipoprotein
MFNDPQLNALESRVELSNQNVIAAMARYREARDQVRIARAALFPIVTATPAVIASHNSGTSARGSVINANTASSPNAVGSATTAGGSRVDYSMPVDLSYQADVWGRIRRSVAANAAAAQASAADLENAKLVYQSQLAQIYFELHGLDADADLLKRTLAVYQQSVQLTEDRFAAGIASGADVALAKTQLASTRAQLIDVGVGRAQFEHAIATLIGETPTSLSIPILVVTTPPPVIPLGLPSTLMERRPDVTAMERAIAAANEQIGVAKAAFFPVLMLGAAGGFESTSLAQWFSLPSRFWAVGPQLAATLFDGGKRRAQVDLSEAAYDESVATYRQTVLTAFQQVEDQLSTLRILEQESAAEAEAVKAAQETLDIVRLQYTAGTADYLQVIVVQAAALQTQRQELDILTRRRTASVLLIEALGGGWDASQLPSQ